MKILVCIKQVPDDDAPVAVDRDGTRWTAAEGAAWRINRYDEHALEEALRTGRRSRERGSTPSPPVLHASGPPCGGPWRLARTKES
jgi:electron transfer flavoprotein alpha/beta subunit